MLQLAGVNEMEKIRERMSAIDDPRHSSYVKYPLEDILSIIMCAVLCGIDSLGELVIFAKSREEFMTKEFGFERIPSKATFARILSMIDGKQIGDAILDVMRQRFNVTGEVIAVDGKAIRSTVKPGKPHSALQILSAYLTDSGITLAQEAIHKKTNEIPIFQEMLTYLDVKGKLVTADALHCQKETCRKIVQKKGDYVFGLKGNQPSLLKDVSLFFNDDINRSEWEFAQTLEKNAGRIEKRICCKATNVAWLKHHDWPGLKTVFMIKRIVDAREQRSEETSYYISSRDASSRQLMDFVREHWKIESMHWMLDVTFSEDSCRLLSENAHKTLNALRKFSLAVHKQFLAANRKKSTLKGSMLSALLRTDYLSAILHFL